MDTSGREDNEDVKSKLTYLCSGLSIACLIFTIVLSLHTRKSQEITYDKERNLKTLIVCNLSVCLLIVNLLVVSAMDNTNNKVRVDMFVLSS